MGSLSSVVSLSVPKLQRFEIVGAINTFKTASTTGKERKLVIFEREPHRSHFESQVLAYFSL